METWREELYHHGILGQKWGVTNGPPYPLDAKSHSTREKKAGWRKSLDKAEQGSNYTATRSGANQYRRALSKADSARSEEYSKYMRADTARDKYEHKESVARSKGKIKKAEKYKKKSEEAKSQAQQHSKNEKEMRSEISKFVKLARKQGYDVTESDILRMSKSERGSMIAQSILLGGGLLPAAAVAGVHHYTNSRTYGDNYQTTITDRYGNKRTINQNQMAIKGSKYKVTKKKR